MATVLGGTGVSEVFRVFVKLGLTSFGGPVAHLGYFREEFVGKRRWVSESEYAELLALCQFLPGPASSQLGFALGLSRAGFAGALAAWAGFTLPSALLLVLFAAGSVSLGGDWGSGILAGLLAVAVAVVAHAVWGMGRSLAPDVRRIGVVLLAAASALLLSGVWGQLAAIGIGAVVGLIWCRSTGVVPAGRLLTRVSRRTGAFALALFVVLLAALPVLTRITHSTVIAAVDAFYRAGALVFGGGHVVLPLLQAEPAIASAVSPQTFLAGYGAAQAVPGPLFSFAAYLGFEMGEGSQSLVFAAVALVAVFVPGLLLVVGVLPFWARLRESASVRAAVTGVNAAVVGMLLAALWHPIVTTGITGWVTLGIAAVSALLLFVWRLPAWIIVCVGAGLGRGAAVLGVGFGWG